MCSCIVKPCDTKTKPDLIVKKARETPYISADAARFLAHDKKIKMVGIQGIGLEEPGKMEVHENFLKNDIPIIDVLTNLDKVEKERVFFIGLPLNIAYIDSS